MENKNVRYILDNIISKAKYNEKTNTYEITEEDYLYLNLTSKQKSLLKKMCDKIGIKLEYTRYTKDLLPSIENEVLFEEYNSIKKELETIQNEELREILEQRRISIRNKIFNDNIKLVNAIIERRISRLDNPKEFEDITQTSYEILLEYIDNNYLYKGIFKDRISKLLLLYASRKLLYENEAIGEDTKNYLEELNRAKEIKETIDLEELSKIINMSQNKVKELLNIDGILTSLSLEEEISLVDSEEYNDDSLLYDDSFEKEIINIQRKKTIFNILSTLSNLEQELLILYFGLNGDSYTMKEIGEMYNRSKSYISLVINKALETIKSSIRINYLKEVYDVPETYQDIEQTSNKVLEEFLIRNLPKETIEYIKPYLEKDVLNFLEVYTTNHNYKLKEISESLNIPLSKAFKLKLKTLSSIQYIISNQLNQNSKEKLTYEGYLDYLMQLWIKNNSIKRRVR